jgi:hypothetical protein
VEINGGLAASLPPCWLTNKRLLEIKKEIVIKIPLNKIPDAEFQIGHWG